MKLLVEVVLVAICATGLSSIATAGFACLSNPCNYGICVDDLNSSYTCYCIDGYTGIQCQTNWDECWSNPCLNGGTCIDGVASYNCSCPAGFMGDQCEENFDECDSNPCLNNGTCLDGVNGYICQCLPGYAGVLCEIDEAVCNTTEESHCLNGGICVEGPGISFSCICTPGWSGLHCEIPIDECASSPCQNGAVCVDSIADYACACVFGYTGKNCEFKLLQCDVSPCKNDALCLIENGVEVCYCVPDFHGNRCQFQYDECQLGPRCMNGGTCLDGVDNFTCSCPPYLTGRFCECLIISSGEVNCSIVLLPTTTLLPISESQSPLTALTFHLPSTIPTEEVLTQSSTSSREIGKTYEATSSAPTLYPKTTMSLTSGMLNLTGVTSEQVPFELTSASFMPSIQTEIPETELTMLVTKRYPNDTLAYSTKSSISTLAPEAKTFSVSTDIETKTPAFISTEIFVPKSVPTSTLYSETVGEIFPITKQTESVVTTEVSLVPAVTAISDTRRTTLHEEVTVYYFTEEYATTIPEIYSESLTETVASKTETPESTDFSVEHTEVSSIEVSTILLANVSATTKSEIPTAGLTSDSTTMLLGSSSSTVHVSSTTEVLDCSITPCLHGGTCVHSKTGPKCQCTFGWSGPSCEVHIGTIGVAAFTGQSFLKHLLNKRMGAKIEIRARTLAPNGILLYAHLTSRVYMSVFIQSGFLNFQFSCGIQTMLFTEVKIQVNNGYDLKVEAMLEFLPHNTIPQHCNAYLRINDSLAMSGEQIAAVSHSGKPIHWLHLGGLPPFLLDHSEVKLKLGFVGCMHALMIDSEQRNIFDDALTGSGVSECASLACLSNPCYGGGTCVEHMDKWNCLCPSGYIGRSCETSVCEINPCQFGATCVIFPGSGYLCLCPLGKHGIFCEHDLEIGQPSFSPSVAGLASYTAYPLPGAIHQNMELRFRFKPDTMEQISLMAFVGQGGYHDAQSDHLAVSFIKGYIVLTWNLGSGPRRIFTTRPITQRAKRPHFVSLGRSGRHAWLRVDNIQNVTGISPGHMNQLNTHSFLYIGGHESVNFSILPHDLPLHSGFSGCLFDVELRAGRISVPLQKTRTAIGRGVGQCGTTECHERACYNGGACLHHGATYVCLCPDGWFGPVCAQRYNPCDSMRHNCSSGATCVPLAVGYECDCPIGKAGTYCEKNETLSDVSFSGKRSYMSLPISNPHENQICIELEIKPLRDRGLVLYIGQPDEKSFISLSLQGGILELRVLPGKSRKQMESLVVRSGRVLGMGEWHEILAWRYGRKLILRVDGSVNIGTMPQGDTFPSVGNIIFLGGVKDFSYLPPGVVSGLPVPFKGCMRKLHLNWQRVPLYDNNTLSARNVADCDGTACGGDVCEHGGTCWLDDFSKPHCNCQKQYTGSLCEIRLPCTNDSCKNNGYCISKSDAVSECSCPLGWSGATCEEVVAIVSPHFGGNSYMVIKESLRMAKDYKLDLQERKGINYLYLNFSTIQSDGMILWSSSDEEYLGIGLEDGLLKFAWGWKKIKNSYLLVSGGVVDDGAWHSLELNLSEWNISIWIDSQLVHSEMDNTEIRDLQLKTDGTFYLGGFPRNQSALEQSRGLFSSYFMGCVKELAWNKEMSVTDFSNFQGENIGSCAFSGV